MASESFLAGELALTAAAAFTGAAIYINAAEQPARLLLEARPLLAQWKASYVRGFAMQASVALLSAMLGLLTFWMIGNWLWIAGALLIFASWPYTLLVILPLNTRLQSAGTDSPPQETHVMIERWGRLHAVRGVLGLLATASYLWALIAGAR